MTTMATTTSSKPCPYCGCPYPGDHTLDCPAPKELVTSAHLEEIASELALLKQRLTLTEETLAKFMDKFIELTKILS